MSSKSHVVCWHVASDDGEHSRKPGLHVTPQVELTHTGIPLPLTGGAGQMLPHDEQFAASLVRSRQPEGQLVCPVGQVAQSVPAVLQPLGHVIVVALHVPFASHIAGSVSTPFAHDLPAPHSVPWPLLPLSTQADAPVAHDVTPVLHGFVGWQA
jgi:hypothetical protein